MPIEFKLPKLGENIPSGDIVGILVKEGDKIEANQPVFDVMADKTNAQITCPHAGRIAKIHVKEGQTVPVDGLLLTIEEGAEAKGKEASQSQAPQQATEHKAEPKKELQPEESSDAPQPVA